MQYRECVCTCGANTHNCSRAKNPISQHFVPTRGFGAFLRQYNRRSYPISGLKCIVPHSIARMTIGAGRQQTTDFDHSTADLGRVRCPEPEQPRHATREVLPSHLHLGICIWAVAKSDGTRLAPQTHKRVNTSIPAEPSSQSAREPLPEVRTVRRRSVENPPCHQQEVSGEFGPRQRHCNASAPQRGFQGWTERPKTRLAGNSLDFQ